MYNSPINPVVLEPVPYTEGCMSVLELQLVLSHRYILISKSSLYTNGIAGSTLAAILMENFTGMVRPALLFGVAGSSTMTAQLRMLNAVT